MGWEREPDGIYLDLCAGTLDFAATLARQPGFRGRVVGADFVPAMLRLGRGKAARLAPVTADALELPFPDASFDGAMVGWGVRNLVDLDAGLAEAARVLKPGAGLVILEMTLAAPAAAAPTVFQFVLPAGAAVDRPSDLETYDRLYVATRVDARVSRAGRSWRVGWRRSGFRRRLVHAVPGRRLRDARGDAGREKVRTARDGPGTERPGMTALRPPGSFARTGANH